jgi:hypothetical protein
MPTHVKRNSAVVVALALTCSLGFAQRGPIPPPSQTSGPTAPVPQGQGGNSTEIDSSTSTALDYLFNHKAGEGTTMKAGNDVAAAIATKIQAVDVLRTPGLSNPEMKARFETYLSLKEVPQARIDEYFSKMKDVSIALKAGDSFGAWKLLYALGDYTDLDAGISRELAARVETFWNTDRTKNGLEIANAKLQDDAQKAIHNADLDAQDIAETQASQSQKSQKGNNNNNTSNVNQSNTTNSPINNPNADPAAAEAAVDPTLASNLQGKLEMTGQYLNLLEARAKIKLNEIRENKMSDQDRMDFSDYIKTLYSSHRYYHVIIAADFYRALFNEGDYPQDIANQAAAGAANTARTASDAAKLNIKSIGLNASGPASAINNLSGIASGDTAGQGAQAEQPLTIADEVTSAYEINNRVSQAIEVFRYKADKGEIAAAADELQQAFVGNEYHPGLQGLPRDEKEKVGEYLTKIDILRNQLEVRAFEQVDGQIADIQKIATDFDSTKPMALVNGIKLESRLQLGKARLLAQAGQLSDAMSTFQTAAELWPGNPDLNTSSNLFFKSEDNQNQSTGDFDRLVKEQDARQLFERQLEFALAVKGDATREQQLKDALTKVGKAKVAEEKANMLMMNGDVNGAWETIELAQKDWPDDTKLNKLLADLSGRSADFVSALNKARDAESKREFGYSLTWYVAAQSTYPPSTIANEGIDRVSKQILSPQSASSDATSSAN